MKNLELFDRLAVKFHDRILFVKGESLCKSTAWSKLKDSAFCVDVGSESSEVCQWKFFGKGAKRAEVCCTSIVYATDKKQTKVRR